MFKFLLAFLLLPAWASGQFFHQIPDCYTDITPVQYTIERNANLEYSYQITGGEILSTDANGVLVNWFYNGQLTVISTNDLGCSSNSTLAMELTPCNETTFYIPNAFTPNDDYTNDRFAPKGVNFKYFDMTVYTRWGQEIYFTRNIAKGWDGRYNNRLCPNDVYVYQITYQDHKNYYKTLNGKLVLIR
jgi:gliding motility-associated-like protein